MGVASNGMVGLSDKHELPQSDGWAGSAAERSWEEAHAVDLVIGAMLGSTNAPAAEEDGEQTDWESWLETIRGVSLPAIVQWKARAATLWESCPDLNSVPRGYIRLSECCLTPSFVTARREVWLDCRRDLELPNLGGVMVGAGPAQYGKPQQLLMMGRADLGAVYIKAPRRYVLLDFSSPVGIFYILGGKVQPVPAEQEEMRREKYPLKEEGVRLIERQGYFRGIQLAIDRRDGLISALVEVGIGGLRRLVPHGDSCMLGPLDFLAIDAQHLNPKRHKKTEINEPKCHICGCWQPIRPSRGVVG
jgi:hypothetical protein